MIVCGIDPGFEGALAKIWTTGKEGRLDKYEIIDMPVIAIQTKSKTSKKGTKSKKQLDGQAIRNYLIGADHVFIEIAGARPIKGKQKPCPKCGQVPTQGTVSTGNYMMGYGILQGICIGLQISHSLIHPATWKAAMMRDMPKGKETSILRAKQLFPDIDLHRKKDHGKAEAILLNLYGIKQLSERI